MWEGAQSGCVTALLMLMETEGLRLPEVKWGDEPEEMTIRVI